MIKTFKEAVDILFENTATDTIMESFETSEFWEFITTAGGDVSKYRIYKKDGRICEK